MRSAPPVAPAPMPQPSGHSGQDLPTDSSGQPGRYIIVPASQETGQQDPEQPDRVPALPTVRPRDQMPPNMGSHVEPNISNNDSNVKRSRMVQDIEVVEHHTWYARPTQGCTSKHRRVLEVPEELWCTLHCKTKEYNHSDCGDISCGGQNCKSTDAAGRACKCFRGRNHRTSRRVHGDYAGRHDHCECRPANHLAPTVNARF